MTEKDSTIIIKEKKPVRKVRFSIVLKLSLFVAIIQLIVLLTIGTVFVNKESDALKRNINLQVSSMMNSFKDRLVRTANRINDATLSRIENPNSEIAQAAAPEIGGNVFIQLNNILKDYTGTFSLEDNSSMKFRVSEIMVLNPNGWIIVHSRDDRWSEQHQSRLSNRPLASLNSITIENLYRLDKLIFDKFPDEMNIRNINGLDYFESAFPVYAYKSNYFREIPGLINAVEKFKLVYSNFLKGKFFKKIEIQKEISQALYIFNEVLNEIYLYVDFGLRFPNPVKITKLGNKMIKEKLLYKSEFNKLRLTANMLTEYVQKKWFFSVLYQKDFKYVVDSINNVIKNDYIEKFQKEIKENLNNYISKIKNALDSNENGKVKNLVEELFKYTGERYQILTSKFPSVSRMNNLERKIRIFSKDIGEGGQIVYKAGIEPYEKYFKGFRVNIVNCLNLLSSHNHPGNENNERLPKRLILNLLNNALKQISEYIPVLLKERVLKVIKIEFVKYANAKIFNKGLLLTSVNIIRNIRKRLKSKKVVDIIKSINNLRKELPYTLIREFNAILRKKQIEEAKKRRNANINRNRQNRISRLRQQNSRNKVKKKVKKEKWEKIYEDALKNSFFKKDIRIIGELKRNSLKIEKMNSLPFYALLYIVKQYWRSFTNYEEIPRLKKSFTKKDSLYYRYLKHRLVMYNIVAPYLKENVNRYLRYRELKIKSFPPSAFKAMHTFSVEDIARMYPFELHIRNLIDDWNKALKSNFWKNRIKITGKYIELTKNFVQNLCASMMHRYKIGYIILRVKKEQYETYLRASRNKTIDYSVSILLRTIFLSIIFSGIFLKSLKSLTEAAEEIGRGNLEKKILLTGTDEFGQLADTLNNMTHNLLLAREELITKMRMEEELKLAQEIQETLLPLEKPHNNNFTFADYYQAQTETGGDYFDYLTNIGKDHIGLVVADVSGHGVGASLVMTMIRSVIRSQAIGIGKASNVLKNINPFIYRDTTSRMYATLWYGILNIKTKVLNYSVAGHNPAIIYNPISKTFTLLKIGGMPVGLVDNETFAPAIESHAVQLKKGDILIQYTDGVTEAMNKKMEEYGEDRFYDCVKKLGNVSADKVVKTIVKDIENFTGGIEQSDDITLLVMKVEK